ncbi:hypothetical protein GF420_15810 [candidate division GN15 bacterium]|nr:hypothetical protein [candidate division GN15 bacterium]
MYYYYTALFVVGFQVSIEEVDNSNYLDDEDRKRIIEEYGELEPYELCYGAGDYLVKNEKDQLWFGIHDDLDIGEGIYESNGFEDASAKIEEVKKLANKFGLPSRTIGFYVIRKRD